MRNKTRLLRSLQGLAALSSILRMMSTSMPARGKFPTKAKANRVMASGVQHVMTIGSQEVAHKVIIVQSIIRRDSQADVQSVDPPDILLLSVLVQSSPKPRMSSGKCPPGLMKTMNGMTINGVKGKDLSRRGSPRARVLQDRLHTDLNDLEKGMPWRNIQDEFGKFKWIDHLGRIYHGTPFSVEPDITSKHVFIASMMHTSSRSPVLHDTPDVTCPSDLPDSEKRKEVVRHEQIPDQDVSKHRRQHANDKNSNVVIKAKAFRLLRSPWHPLWARCERDGW